MAIRIPILWRNDDSGLKAAQASVNNFSVIAGGALARIGSLATEAFVQAARAAVNFGVDSVKVAAEAEAVSRSLEQIAQNSSAFAATTKDIKGATDALMKHSTELAKITGIDDEVLNSMKRTWLAVPELAARGAEGINNLAVVAADVAAGTGKSIETIGQAFIKVTGDEETALSKLQRAGIVLSDQQKATYDQILATNGQIAAQDYLIGTLGETYKGAAAAAADPFTKLKQTVEEFQETVGGVFLESLTPAITLFGTELTKLAEDPAFIQLVKDMAAAFAELAPQIIDLLPSLVELATKMIPLLIELIPILIPIIDFLAEVIGGTAEKLESMKDPGNALLFWGAAIFPILKFVAAGFEGAATFGEDFKQVMISMASPISGLVNFFVNLDYWIGRVVSGFRTLFGFNAKLPTGAQLKLSAQAGGIPGLAAGGNVVSGGLTWVGENGPELLNLPAGSQVTPLDRVSGGGSTYNISISTLKADASIGEIIVNSIQRYERSSGPVFAKA